jgi:ferredoxin
MSMIEINDVAMEARPGERLLDIARRNAAHVGFYCDGLGLCTTCECRILEGAENLNPANEVEDTWLPQERQAAGYRLACQASIRGPGEIRVLTRAEELRRQFGEVLTPPPGTTRVENLRPFLSNIAMINWEHIGTFPFNLLRTMQRIGPFRMIWPVQDLNQLVDDTVRITRRMLNEADGAAEDAEPKAPGELPAGPSSSPAPSAD